MDYATISKTGSRENNEDAFLAAENENGSLFVVADGLGGHGKGEVASAIVTGTFQRMFSECDAGRETFIPEAMLAAQDEIMREQRSSCARSDMKTTCAALHIAGGTYRTGHVGDTRIYVFRKYKVDSRTRDHSVPQMLAMSGEIKERQIRGHPDRNRLLRVLGIEWDSPLYELSDALPMDDCQAFLLCSDGFWELCDEKTMCRRLKKSGNAAQWLEAMASDVERRGGGKDMDNYTAIAVKV